MKTDFANWSEMVIIVYLGKYIQVNKSSNEWIEWMLDRFE